MIVLHHARCPVLPPGAVEHLLLSFVIATITPPPPSSAHDEERDSEVETAAAAHQLSNVDLLASEHSAHLNKWVSFDGSPLRWHRVIHSAAFVPPGFSSTMKRIPAH